MSPEALRFEKISRLPSSFHQLHNMLTAFRSSWKKVEEKAVEDFVFVERPLTKIHDDVPEVFRLGKCCGVDLYEVTIDQLQSYFSNDDLTAYQYTLFCLENIRKVSSNCKTDQLQDRG